MSRAISVGLRRFSAGESQHLILQTSLISVCSLRPKEVDLLVCPEMFLTGYMFTSPSDIKPFLEPTRIGRTSLFCRELATRYQCWVVGGYPELASDPGEEGKPGYNSAVLVSPSGEVVGNYRKSFLYDTDKTWAREGQFIGTGCWLF